MDVPRADILLANRIILSRLRLELTDVVDIADVRDACACVCVCVFVCACVCMYVCACVFVRACVYHASLCSMRHDG